MTTTQTTGKLEITLGMNEDDYRLTLVPGKYSPRQLIAMGMLEEDATEVVRRYNAHDAMLAALETLVARCTDEHGAVVNAMRAANNYGMVSSLVREARAAIEAAR